MSEIEGKYQKIKYLSLRWKFSIPLIALGLLGIISFTWLFSLFFINKIEMQVLKQTKQTMQIISYATERVFINTEQLQGFISLIANDDDIQDVLILSGEPLRVIATTNRQFIHKPLDAVFHDTLLYTHLVDAIKDNRPYYDQINQQELRFIMPLRFYEDFQSAEPISSNSAMLLIVNTSDIYTVQSETLWHIFSFSLGFVVLIGTAIYLLLNRLVLHPAKIIRDAISRQTNNNKIILMPRLAMDEIGLIAQTFNTMLLEQERNQNEIRKLALVVERTNNAVIITDAQQRIEWVNQGFTRMTGYRLHEVIGRVPGHFLQGVETDPNTVQYMRQKLAEGNAFQVELVNYSKIGRRYEVAIETQPVCDEQGRIVQFMAIESDITARKAAELEIRQTKDFLNTIVSHLPLALFAKEPENLRFILWNKYCEQLFGLNEADVLGKTDYDFFPVKEASLYQTYDRQVLNNGSLVDIPEEIIHSKTLGERIAHTRKVAVLGQDKKVVMLLVILEDITEQKNAAQALQASEERFRTLVEASSDWVWETNTHFINVYSSPKVADLLGYTPEEIQGRSLYSFMSSKETEQAIQTINPYLQTQKPFRFVQNQWLHKDGHLVILEMNGVPMLDTQGKYIGYRGIGRDVTARYEMEMAVRQQAQELSLLNQELLRASRLKDEFLANMSHELRTPLNSILALIEILQEQVYGVVNAQQQKYLSNIDTSGRHLLALINDILDLSKIAAGKMELEIQSTILEGVCQASMNFIREQALRKKIRVTTHYDHNVNKIEADERRLKQILINLLTNAVKFTPEKGEIGLEYKGIPDKKTLEIHIWDTGIGIDKNELSNLFKPFTQLNTTQHEGTGLGLALVRRLTALHGGDVQVNSEMGKGSRFIITLPWRPNDIDNTAPTTAPTAETATIELHKPDDNPLILIVDDNDANILSISDYLTLKGYRTTIAHNGIEAIESANKLHPDLILMDIQMPVMNGLDAITHLRADKTFKTVPIIAVTALAMSGDRERCLNVGANEYLAKPIGLRHLVSVIERLRQQVLDNSIIS
ncbi:PAS domain-containing hybrid sensor histidine kinase/response regulator [Beggiatoa leptomitoformis]|uniref:histidine kinase n=1 Tax=Beggiatoa leptomitoformis TaxID=288004 RepID=A0A2N9YEQ3_9GAMM|nr:PAS domain-containing hybrid sensor histidine kinase/response regulator [Beggiatoa leptomitoformis]AUI68916.1 PAS domain S-box protein [Beggiatoa leptomitoformis]QGX03780.1 PAS domain S-box protein [Beggiatoa leptomitoformis]